MKNLQALFEDVKEDFDALSIPYRNVVSLKVNHRAKRWGLCRRIAGTQTFEIEINHRLLDDSVADQGAKDTIAHELCHTIEGCMNHGSKWKAYAKKLQIFGYTIKRTDSAEDKGISEEVAVTQYKYAIKCKKCNSVAYYNRESKAVRYARRYNGIYNPFLKCSKCRNREFDVIINRGGV